MAFLLDCKLSPKFDVPVINTPPTPPYLSLVKSIGALIDPLVVSLPEGHNLSLGGIVTITNLYLLILTINIYIKYYFKRKVVNISKKQLNEINNKIKEILLIFLKTRLIKGFF